MTFKSHRNIHTVCIGSQRIYFGTLEDAWAFIFEKRGVKTK